MDHSTPGFPVHHQHLELAQTHVHRVSDAIQPSHLLSSPSLLPSIFPSTKVFFSELALRIMWPKHWSFGFTLSPSNEYSGLNSFRIDWFDLLQSKGFSRVLQHYNSKASILQHSAIFIVQLSHPYMTTGKTIALTIRTFVSKVMSLLFNIYAYGPWEIMSFPFPKISVHHSKECIFFKGRRQTSRPS